MKKPSNPKTAIINREDWLKQLSERLNTLMFAGKMPKYRVSCSWPSRGGTGAAKKIIGQCFAPSASSDNTTEIFISPSLDDDMEVAGTLAHEMVHAVVGIPAGHGKAFRKLALQIGLTGKMTSTTEGPEFKKALAPILAELGKYPHAQLNVRGQLKKQGTRLIKAECTCGYTVRITRKWLNELGAPHCPAHGEMGVPS